jgi:hypothetical protein
MKKEYEKPEVKKHENLNDKTKGVDPSSVPS